VFRSNVGNGIVLIIMSPVLLGISAGVFWIVGVPLAFIVIYVYKRIATRHIHKVNIYLNQIDEETARARTRFGDKGRNDRSTLHVLNQPKEQPCFYCNGTGRTRAQQGSFTVERTCFACRGSGKSH
jgi:carbon starvation protein CstA